MNQSVKDGKRAGQFIPPEGVPITFAIASLGTRFGAQFLDILFTTIVIFICAFAIVFTGVLPASAQGMLMVLLGFLVQTPYYILSELIWNGRTLGKRITGIRVINVDGRRLTPHQVTARNLMKEVEIFAPMGLLASVGTQSAWENGLTTLWFLVVVVVPFANRRRQRIGDIIAGTLVVDNPRSVLLSDLVLSAPAAASSQQAFEFLAEHLDVYGKYELQTLEDVLRDSSKTSNHQEIVQIVKTITRRIRYPDTVKSGQERLFLNEFYRAQREHLESLKLFGTLRENKYHEHTKTEAKKLV
ncbi:RDD family protein [Rhizobium fabae]|uniref:Putative RDD family membrane protein YckC n=1 Tax=Rhizobium fabae TaxID=573179 RepID=A0A7W6B8T3_9HYPH|nr:RDD family protein [Rhizobium fabae]MBB3914714.1 putative RDD family membrane protein YckC [Rhizobium fabae]RUM14395.1 RDD family protein [Rhizobium fabae]